MNPLASFFTNSLLRPLEIREVIVRSKQRISILRDDRLAFGIGTKFRKFFGIHSEMESKGIRTVILQGELHSNLVASFSLLFRIFGYHVRTIAYSRDPKRISMNAQIVKKNSHVLETFQSRSDWKAALLELKKNFSENPEADENRYRMKYKNSFQDPNSSFEAVALIPEYGFGLEASQGLNSLWEQIPILEFDHLAIDIGSGLTWLSARNFFRDRIPVSGVSVGLDKKKMIPWLREKQEELNFSGFEIDEESIWASEDGNGFGSASANILEFNHIFYRKHSVPIEPIYSGKSLYSIRKKMERSEISGRILYLHQGGLWNFLDSFLPLKEEKV
ncbi:1-aminocyclopropane-1-carboxylate deaminase [Leptospira adleri]|uniref:1-aminocyclopropane-1-carboxylate deaminase n=1 Tax=Leptospira adleri TaxID=2023186 RepID=A0A2M9YLX0_9LEPT|nr:1-aminocyclopropane-1-carboxylate deaminase [Leptospira adleri]PJZ52534.1 hypothetical protein CH380_13790 [Leptospira adleri]PJZ60864.1 hypothetical protein CH376_16225 [Leptospira adleri]